MDFDRIVSYLKRGILPPALIVRVLRPYATSEDQLKELLDAIEPQELVAVYKLLILYPSTDFGWAILPPARDQFRSSLGKSSGESDDLDKLQFGEDRVAVEAMRRDLEIRIDGLNISRFTGQKKS